MRYRDHKEQLSDSLDTTIEVNSKQDIINHLNEYYSQLGMEVEEIKFEHIGFDERCNWDTYYVLRRIKGEDKWMIVGMSDGKL